MWYISAFRSNSKYLRSPLAAGCRPEIADNNHGCVSEIYYSTGRRCERKSIWMVPAPPVLFSLICLCFVRYEIHLIVQDVIS